MLVVLMPTYSVQADDAVPTPEAPVPGDVSPPVVSISAPVVITGNSVTLSGIIQDDSAIFTLEVSTDSMNSWSSVSRDGDTWSFNWNCSGLEDGHYYLFVRAVDEEGNSTLEQSETRIGRAAPILVVNFPGQWYLWEDLPIGIDPGANDVARLIVQVSDSQDRGYNDWEEYPNGQIPSRWRWDRQIAEGMYAPTGTYSVQVWAEDIYGQQSNRFYGNVVIPEPPTATPTNTLIPTATATPLPTATLTPTSTTTMTTTPTSIIELILSEYEELGIQEEIIVDVFAEKTTVNTENMTDENRLRIGIFILGGGLGLAFLVRLLSRIILI